VRLRLARPHDPRLPLRIGFRERYRHAVVDLRECLVMEPPLFVVSQSLRRIGQHLFPPGASANVTLTRTDSGIDLLIDAAERPELGALEALAKLAEECDLARLVWLASGDEITVVERRPVRLSLSGVAVPFPHGAFLQASQSAETILIEEVLSGIGARRPVLDLFAGLGTFSFALAQGGPVHAVEGRARAVTALAHAAVDQPKVTVEQRDLAREPLPPEWLARYAAAVFDPPRGGAIRVSEALAASALDTVVAISCNPATFARDAAKLIAGGYRLER
jgi:23S rRNA (uracil1939-C5)-methyltransferase